MCVYKLINEFEEQHDITIRIKIINKQTLFILKREGKYWSIFFRRFCDFLYKRKLYHDQYVASVLKVVRTFFNYLLKEKHFSVGNFHLQLRLAAPSYTPVIIQPHQLRFLLFDNLFTNALPAHLKRTKDIFLFGCTVGLRYSDLMKLKRTNILKTNRGIFLQLYTQKTVTLLNLPVPGYLLPIIEKYKSKAAPYILPRLSNVNFNLQIKQVIERAGWIDYLPKLRHREGKVVEIKTKDNKSMRFCDHVTAHTMRRTAITVLLMLGVPELAVRKVSGHAAGSKEFYKYISLAEDYVTDHVQQAYQRLMKQEINTV
jgi:integrase